MHFEQNGSKGVRMKRIVLIVDDSDQTVLTLEVAFACLAEVETRWARDGADALRILAEAENGICALITDLNMPRLDGYGLIGKLRSDPHRLNLPIIAVSAETDPGVGERARSAGADAFFAKPFSPSLVRDKLERLLHEDR